MDQSQVIVMRYLLMIDCPNNHEAAYYYFLERSETLFE